MKYFKPELLAKCRSSNPDTAEAAAAEWLKKADAYREHLQEIRDRLPRSVRSLLRSVALHDARLLTVNLAQRQDRLRYYLSFRLAGKDDPAGMQLCYDAVKSIKTLDHEPKAARDTTLFALYDEFDVLADGILTHSILLTGGIEIRMTFAKLTVIPFNRVAAADRRQPDIKKELVEMAAS